MPTNVLTNEFRLLVACSWAPPEPHRAAQGARIAELCRRPLEWESIPALALRHQTPALACLALERWAAPLVPAPVLAELRVLAAKARTRSLFAAAECARVSRALAAQGVPMLPLKGGPLSADLYGDPAARHAADVDILVRDGDLDRAEAILDSLGYQPEFPRDRLTPRMRGLLRASSTAATWRHSRLKLAIDMHWDQELWTRAQLDQLWRRSQPAECLGAPMRRLDADMLLLYLCDHGAKHDWSRLKWLSDVAMILARPRPRPWGELFALARELDAEVSLAAAALLVEWLYGLDLPPEVIAFVRRDARAPVLAREAIAAMRMTHDELLAATRCQSLGRKLRHQMLRRPALPLAEHLRTRLLHPDDLARFALPDSLLWLHYPLRPFFWLWRHCRPLPVEPAGAERLGPPRRAMG